jgi:hypothetical protein
VPELDLVKGPLSDQMLVEVAELYGKTDGKYGDVEHCRLLFNLNPFGPALHAFAREQGAAIGHYCLIPYDLNFNGTEVRAAKGEALHLLADYRRSDCRGVPTSNALLDGAQELARQEKIPISYAVVGAPGVIRLFQRCGYEHRPFQIHDLVVPKTKALPLARVLQAKGAEFSARLSSSAALVEVDFQAVEEHLPLQLECPDGAWQPVLKPETLRWFGKAPNNRYFKLGRGVVWLTQTHDDWEVLCTFTHRCSEGDRRRFVSELRKEATSRSIDVIRVPLLPGVEESMRKAFKVLARRQVTREISFVVRSSQPVGPASPLGFLWAHF